MFRLVIASILSLFQVCWAGEMTPFVIPGQANPASEIAYEYEPIGTSEAERVQVNEEGHFEMGNGERLKVWGVNLSFGGNLPAKQDAARLAERLARAGVNSVRVHHLDSAKFPRGIWGTDGRELSAEALDRLDYFIHELAQRGIYINLNLHVGREHSRYLGLPESPERYDKIVSIFTPELIAAQKEYARAILERMNPYRGGRYVDDPAIAFVEITNENSLFMWSASRVLPNLPEYYDGILQDKFQDWLREEYQTTTTLRQAWNAGSEPLGENRLRNASFSRPEASCEHWDFEQHDGCRISPAITTYRDKTCLKIRIDRTDETAWHLKLNQRGLAVEKGQYYSVIFEAAAEQPRKIACTISQNHAPWRSVGEYHTVELTPEWQTFRLGITAGMTDENVRLSFTFGGGDKTPFYLRNIRLCTGGQQGLGENESLAKGTVELFARNETQSRAIDRMRFLGITEKAFFDGMYRTIKEELGYQGLVTGTIVFGPLGLYGQSDMDFIDTHAYWHHPRFPGRPWDRSNWIVEQEAMTDSPAKATLMRLAARRLGRGQRTPGKPFTVSEYNHPAPMDAQAECVPMIASFAALQDGDGVWLYSYMHAPEVPDKDHFTSFFDIAANPGKWGFVPAGAAVFRFGRLGLTRDDRCSFYPLTRLGELTGARAGGAAGVDAARELAALHAKSKNLYDHFPNQRHDFFLHHTAYFTLNEMGYLENCGKRAAEAVWDVEDGMGVYGLATEAGWVMTGHRERINARFAGRITVTGPEFLALTVTALGPEKVLITACGRCENTGMGFSQDRRTVGRNWGHGPVRIEAVNATLTLPMNGKRCCALNPDGTIKHNVPMKQQDGKTVIELSEKHGTMWYLLTYTVSD